MPPSRIAFRSLQLGPEVPLGRRGCVVESHRSNEDASGWDDGFFAGAFKRERICDLLELLKDRGEEVFTVIKRIAHDKSDSPLIFNEQQQVSVSKLLELGVIEQAPDGKLSLEFPRGEWGALLECATLVSLGELHIQGHRAVKVRYPNRNVPYDRDGQHYDVLAALDISGLLWIECKKPLYLPDNSNLLGQTITKEFVKKFYDRAHFLRPSIAVFLVDTINDYRPELRTIFSERFRTNSGCYQEFDSPGSQLMARLHGFIYFVRIDYGSTGQYMKALRQSISQVLHDARKEWIYFGFEGDPFERTQ